MYYRSEMSKLSPQVKQAYSSSYFEYKRKTYKSNDANALTKSIIAFFELLGYQAERISSMGRVIDNRKSVTDVLGRKQTIGSTKYIPGTSKKGTADISVTIFGMSIKVEVKFGKDRQSNDQKVYEMSIKDADGIYFIAKDFQQFYEWIYPLLDKLKRAGEAAQEVMKYG